MKTAISVPDRVFREADRLAKRLKKSRSELYSEAVAEYLGRHAPDAITAALNDVCDAAGAEDDGFVAEASRRALGRDE